MSSDPTAITRGSERQHARRVQQGPTLLFLAPHHVTVSAVPERIPLQRVQALHGALTFAGLGRTPRLGLQAAASVVRAPTQACQEPATARFAMLQRIQAGMARQAALCAVRVT